MWLYAIITIKQSYIFSKKADADDTKLMSMKASNLTSQKNR